MEEAYTTSDVTNHSKESLDSAITLESVTNPLGSLKTEFLTVDEELTNLAHDNCIRSHRGQLDINTLQSVSSHNKSNLLNSPSILEAEKSLNLANFSHPGRTDDVEADLQMTDLTETENGLTLDSNHYYEGLNSTSIMVYQVTPGSIVPFDSLVPVSFGKAIEAKQDDTDELLENALPSDVYGHASQVVSQSLYILPESSSIFHIDKHSYNRDEKCELSVTDQLPAEFSLSETEYNNSSQSSLPSSTINHFSMTIPYNTSTIDTDSEVALTLASLGNLKSQHIKDVMGTEDEFEVTDIREKMSIIHVNDTINSVDPQEDIPKTTLVLRSRKYKTKLNSGSGPEASVDEKKLGRKRRGKHTRGKTLPIMIDYPGCENESTDAQSHFKRSHISTNQICEPQKENLLGQLLRASKHCEPASLIPEGVVDDVIPAVGYRIMDMSNLSEMIRMMHRCTNSPSGGPIVIQEQASLREGVVSQLSIICTGCQEGAVCSTSNRDTSECWDINNRVEQLSKEFNIEEESIQRMLEILGIFYRPLTKCVPQFPEQIVESEQNEEKKKRKRKVTKEKTLPCSVCHEMFYGKNHLKSHMSLHNNSLHRCPYCQAYFKKTYNLKEHIKKHENRKYECSECHNYYADKSSLHTHMKMLHENRSRLECEVCNKKFWIKSHYKEHIRVHTGEKPFPCHVCGRTYGWQSSVKKHMRTHSAEAKYKCRLCGRWFRWLLGVRQHLLQQHKLKKCDIEAQVVTAVTETINERLPIQRQLSQKKIESTDSSLLLLKNNQQVIKNELNVSCQRENGPFEHIQLGINSVSKIKDTDLNALQSVEVGRKGLKDGMCYERNLLKNSDMGVNSKTKPIYMQTIHNSS